MAGKFGRLSDISFLRREKLAVLHFNENAVRQQAVTQVGEERWKVKMTKARRGHFTACPVKTSPTFSKHASTLKVGILISVMVQFNWLQKGLYTMACISPMP